MLFIMVRTSLIVLVTAQVFGVLAVQEKHLMNKPDRPPMIPVPPAPSESSRAFVVPLVISVIAIVLVILLIIVLIGFYLRRRTYKSKEMPKGATVRFADQPPDYYEPTANGTAAVA